MCLNLEIVLLPERELLLLYDINAKKKFNEQENYNKPSALSKVITWHVRFHVIIVSSDYH